MQKKIIAIHDIATIGRISLTTAITILNSSGHQCCPVPSAVLSSHMGFPNFHLNNLYQDVDKIIEHLQEININFNAMYSGFLSSKPHISAVYEAAKIFKLQHTLIFVDPVMGDNGRLYKSFSQEMCDDMRQLVKLADIVTPNLTEVGILIEEDISSLPASPQQICNWIFKLRSLTPSNIIVTGINIGNKIGIAILTDTSDKVLFKFHESFNQYFPGTGDLYASVLLSKFLTNCNIKLSAIDAANFVKDCIKYSISIGSNPIEGVVYEPLIRDLIK